MTRHGGQILVDQLRINGVSRVFCVPGESFLAALDGLHDSNIEVVVGRQEGGVAIMAEATGKLTSRPGIAFVTRGPGATNASAGVHVAMQDSTPMILFVGQVASDQRDREAFQEVDYRAMFGPLAKWVAEVDRTDRIPEYVHRAFQTATSGRPGPVVLALPEDMLSAEAHVADYPEAVIVPQGVAEEDAERVAARLREAERPLLIVGGGGWSGGAQIGLRRFAEAWDLPVVTTFRCGDYLDNTYDHYCGDLGIGPDPALAARVRGADLLLVVGARLGEMTTSGYTLPAPHETEGRLFHVHPDPGEIGSVYPGDGLAADSGAFLMAMGGQSPPSLVRLDALREAERRGEPAPSPIPWTEWRRAMRAEREAWTVPREGVGALTMEHVIAHLADALPSNAHVTNGAGNYAGWLHRYFPYRGWPGGRRTQLSPTSGSMGYGLPAAVAAALEDPTRETVCLAGDGCFQMTAQEFGTAAEYGARLVVLVCDNGMYGTIRMHQERAYPGRVSGTRLRNPDFAAWARSYGAHGETVERDADFADALQRARDHARDAGGPALLHLRLDPRALSPTMRLEG